MLGGSGAGMSKSIQQNRSLVHKISVFDRLKDQGSYSKKKKVYQFKKATASQLLRIRENIKEQNMINFILRTTLLLLTVGVVGYVLYLGLTSTTIL